MLKPKVESLVGKKVKTETVLTSLKRLRSRYSSMPPDVARVIAGSVVNVRTDIARLSLKRTQRLIRVVRVIMSRYQHEFLQVLEGLSVITLVYDNKLHRKIVAKFLSSDVLAEDTDLAAITIRSPREISNTPGCVATILQQVSRRGINVEEALSCYTDTVLVVKLRDAGKAFDSLNELITSCREMLAKQKAA